MYRNFLRYFHFKLLLNICKTYLLLISIKKKNYYLRLFLYRENSKLVYFLLRHAIVIKYARTIFVISSELPRFVMIIDKNTKQINNNCMQISALNVTCTDAGFAMLSPVMWAEFSARIREPQTLVKVFGF